MGGGAGHQRSRFFGFEQAGHPRRREQPGKRQAGGSQGVGGRRAEWSQDGRDGLANAGNQGPEQLPVRLRVRAESRGRVLDRPTDHGGPASIQRVGKSYRRGQHFYPPGGQVDTLKKRRSQHERVHGRAHVVTVPGQRQLRRPAPAAEHGRPLVNDYPVAGTGQSKGGRQPVRTGAHDDGVNTVHGWHGSSWEQAGHGHVGPVPLAGAGLLGPAPPTSSPIERYGFACDIAHRARRTGQTGQSRSRPRIIQHQGRRLAGRRRPSPSEVRRGHDGQMAPTSNGPKQTASHRLWSTGSGFQRRGWGPWRTGSTRWPRWRTPSVR